eukprot:GHVP01031857.1.p1 GENE.GHVP01031857.1~~GHVP01031857.1.p1  ORF type:complete len:141 (-),score=20.17 GHVP01031857.1:442-864(-)
MGTRNSPALFAEFVSRALKDLILQYPVNLMTYQDDIAVAANDPETTTKIAQLASDLLLLNGLVENKEKSHWNPVDPKPLLGAIWSPHRIHQKPEAILRLQKLHEVWRNNRTLKDRQKYLGKLASLANFPGLLAKLAANEH